MKKQITGIITLMTLVGCFDGTTINKKIDNDSITSETNNNEGSPNELEYGIYVDLAQTSSQSSNNTIDGDSTTSESNSTNTNTDTNTNENNNSDSSESSSSQTEQGNINTLIVCGIVYRANDGEYFIKEENNSTAKISLASDLETSFSAILIFPEDAKDMCLEYENTSTTFSKFTNTLKDYRIVKLPNGTTTLLNKQSANPGASSSYHQPEFNVTGINYISNDKYPHPERDIIKSNYEYEYCGEIEKYENWNLDGRDVYYISIGTYNYDLLNFSEGFDFSNPNFDLLLGEDYFTLGNGCVYTNYTLQQSNNFSSEIIYVQEFSGNW